jgi:diketogulonate reductase-like aldo/keto reductase
MNSTSFNSTHYVKTLAGIYMPKIIYGTAWKKEKTTDFVVEAILTGFRGIDTACQPKHYQENLVGDALVILEKDHNIPRKDLFIQTKFTSIDGQDPNNIPYDKTAAIPDQVKESFQKSLKNLKTDYIDSLVLHGPLRQYKDTLSVWKTFEEIYSTGQVKQLGISNCYQLNLLETLYNDAEVKPSVIQNRFYADTNYDKGIRDFCRKNGIIYQSFWTLTGNPHIIDTKKFAFLASKNQITPEQLWYKFVMQLGIVPLDGTKTKQHMKEDLDLLDMKDLDKEDMSVIAEFIKEDISYL